MFKKIILTITMLFCMVSLASAFTIHEEIVESDGWAYAVDFTVNNSYTDIVEFVVGNNEAESAEVMGGNKALDNGYLVRRNTNGDWIASYFKNTDILRDVSWMDDLTEFNGYQYAFLFTSWEEEGGAGSYGGYLEIEETDGYRGITEIMESPFAALRSNGGIITGETTHSAVPIPATAWLLGSGLLGLIGWTRKKK